MIRATFALIATLAFINICGQAATQTAYDAVHYKEWSER